MTQTIHVYILQEQDQELKHDDKFFEKQAQNSKNLLIIRKNIKRRERLSICHLSVPVEDVQKEEKDQQERFSVLIVDRLFQKTRQKK